MKLKGYLAVVCPISFQHFVYTNDKDRAMREQLCHTLDVLRDLRTKHGREFSDVFDARTAFHNEL